MCSVLHVITTATKITVRGVDIKFYMVQNSTNLSQNLWVRITQHFIKRYPQRGF